MTRIQGLLGLTHSSPGRIQRQLKELQVHHGHFEALVSCWGWSFVGENVEFLLLLGESFPTNPTNTQWKSHCELICLRNLWLGSGWLTERWHLRRFESGTIRFSPTQKNSHNHHRSSHFPPGPCWRKGPGRTILLVVVLLRRYVFFLGLAIYKSKDPLQGDSNIFPTYTNTITE